ncbi:XRE family transcriptional regulator [Moraxella nasovis]|uniref:helix-turn-helix domain-containing protein n=1 Tax=Moraxella nasovis TaxID=2904121 RepID=UPI001F60116B|nr:XRE family transcriptional regulator [Moraxella nasovis]UNU73363.1 XRE family transcriptional regulator [Moraxella nasovis]
MKFNSVFDALSDTPGQSANLKLRAQLMSHIQKLISEMDGTQAQIAKECGITQPRLNDLLQGKISKFSLDALVNINANLGEEVGLAFA